MEDRRIVFENRYSALHMKLQKGVLYTEAVEDKRTGYRFKREEANLPLFSVPGFSTANAQVTITEKSDDRAGHSAMAKVLDIRFEADGRSVCVELRTYEDNPFIHVSLVPDGLFGANVVLGSGAVESGIETASKKKRIRPDVIFSCPIEEKHLKVHRVILQDSTDSNNILVAESSTTVYSRRSYEETGQLFFVDAYLSGEVLMVAKEAPSLTGRMVQSGYDLRIENGHSLEVAGIGADMNEDMVYDADTPLYGVSFAPGSREELERAWRDYYRLDMQHTLQIGRASMSNTWGDRNQDASVCHSFMLEEIKCAERLGVDVVQIDDGWQKGVSANSKLAKSKLWGSGYYDSDPDYWTPHPEKFPEGLAPIAAAVKEAGVALALWFSPDFANGYENWERDAETLLGLHKQYGVVAFKLDGIMLSDKLTEKRLEAMVEKVHRESEGAVTFNFDITAQKRWGYLYKREYGNLFVENRYTDWTNYYPHSTLRALWMLCRYIPAARLQMEFLNLRRCADKYGNDPLAPNLYSMDWAYAAVMFACPLYWMEMSHLSEEDSAKLEEIAQIRRKIAGDLTRADVTPLGEEPDGVHFTGLRADCETHGYLLLFRENSAQAEYSFAVPGMSDKKLTRLAGTGEAQIQGDTIVFRAKQERSYGLFRYE